MKKKILKFIQITVLLIAIMSAVTPSQMGMYQPECPKKLKSFNKSINMIK